MEVQGRLQMICNKNVQNFKNAERWIMDPDLGVLE